MIWLPIPVVIVLMIIASVFWVIGKASQGAGAVKKKQNAAALRDAAAVGDNTAATGRAALPLAGQLSRAGDTAQARQHYETAAGCTDPEISAQAWAALGVLAFNAKAWDEAARDLRSAIALGSTKQLPGAGLNLGMVERNAGRFDDAIAAFRQVVDLHAPSYSARAMYNLGARIPQSSTTTPRLASGTSKPSTPRTRAIAPEVRLLVGDAPTEGQGYDRGGTGTPSGRLFRPQRMGPARSVVIGKNVRRQW